MATSTLTQLLNYVLVSVSNFSSHPNHSGIMFWWILTCTLICTTLLLTNITIFFFLKKNIKCWKYFFPCVDVDHFYIALFSTLQQTHYALVACGSKWVTVASLKLAEKKPNLLLISSRRTVVCSAWSFFGCWPLMLPIRGWPLPFPTTRLDTALSQVMHTVHAEWQHFSIQEAKIQLFLPLASS